MGNHTARARFCRNAAAIASMLVFGCDDPFLPNDVRHYVDLATGGEHTCAVTDSGEMYCWGRGLDGELGDGRYENSGTPVRVAGDAKFKKVTAGEAHTCALSIDDRVYCWGWTAFFQLGDPLISDPARPNPVRTDVRFRAVTAGAYHTCAIALDQRVYCWGYNRWGQVGNNATYTTVIPTPVAGEFRASSISAGGAHTCALSSSGAAYCWGSNDYAQLGIASDVLSSNVPQLVRTTIVFTSIDAGASHSCAVASNGQPYCWGSNVFGELGDGAAFRSGLPSSATPAPTWDFSSARAVSAGVNHTCAMDPTGWGWCWGRGQYGQLANGSTLDWANRQPIYFLPEISHTGDKLLFSLIAAGGTTHACGLADGSVYCWGTGSSGQLGARQSRFSPYPQRIAD